MFHEEDIQALTFLGMTNLQARVYLSLVSGATVTAKKLAKNADVARQDVYRIVAELEDLSLIEKVISNPTEYRAVPMEDAVDILLGRKQKESLELMIKATELSNRYKNDRSESPHEEDIHYVLIPPKEPFIKKSREFYETSKKCIDVFTTAERAQVAIKIFQEDYEKVLHRGIKVRYLIGRTKDQQVTLNEEGLTKNPFFKLNIITASPKLLTPFIIWDRKDIFIVTTEKEKVYQSQNLWTNNPLLIQLFLNYYELLWKGCGKQSSIT
jgi:sugar-specific transcriptional regulator TrmB